MSNKNYQRGYALENKLVNLLLEKEFILAVRTAGSHSCVDVIGIDTYNTYLFQCKSTQESFISLTNLFKEDSIIKLASLPERFIKVLCLRQGRSKGLTFWKWSEESNVWIPFGL